MDLGIDSSPFAEFYKAVVRPSPGAELSFIVRSSQA